MSIERRLLPVVAITGSSLMVGCGGGSGPSCGSYGSSYGSYGSAGLAANRSRTARAARVARTAHAAAAPAVCSAPVGADGIYEGTLTDQATQQQVPVIAIIAENGIGRMSGQDGTYYGLNVAQSSVDVSGSFYGYSQEASFPNGNRSTSGSLNGSITSPGLSGVLTDKAGDTESLLLNFDPVYSLASSLSMLAGTWSYSANGFSLTATIQTDGTFSAMDSNSCSYSGAFGLIDSNFNAYSENYTLSCNGSSVTYTGLASYFPATGTAAPAYIKMFADDGAGEYLVADLQ